MRVIRGIAYRGSVAGVSAGGYTTEMLCMGVRATGVVKIWMLGNMRGPSIGGELLLMGEDVLHSCEQENSKLGSRESF